MRTCYKVLGVLTVCAAVYGQVLSPSLRADSIYWPTSEVDSTFRSGPSCLALDPDSGLPRVAYVQSNASGGYKIVFRWYDGEQWQPSAGAIVVATVPYSIWDVSLALDADGQPGIAYAYGIIPDPCPYPYFRYFYVDYVYPSDPDDWSDPWSTPQTVVEDIPQARYPESGLFGIAVSCAFRNDGDGDGQADGGPAIAMVYTESLGKDPEDQTPYPNAPKHLIRVDVRYATYSTGWYVGEIETSDAESYSSAFPRGMSLAMNLGATGNFARVAYDDGDDEISYAVQTSSGWDIDSGIASGERPSLALDPDDSYKPHIAFEGSDGSIKYMGKGSQSWSAVETVEADPAAGNVRYPSLALHPDTGQANVAYVRNSASQYTQTEGEFRLVDGSNVKWTVLGDASHDASPYQQVRPSLAMHPTTGKPYVLVSQEIGGTSKLGVAHLQSLDFVDTSGTLLARFTCCGNIILKGQLYEDQSQSSLDESSAEEFIVMNASGSDKYIARIDDGGSIYLKGYCYYLQSQSQLTNESAGEFVVEGTGGKVASIINRSNNGHLKLAGQLYYQYDQVWTP